MAKKMRAVQVAKPKGPFATANPSDAPTLAPGVSDPSAFFQLLIADYGERLTLGFSGQYQKMISAVAAILCVSKSERNAS